MAQQITSQLTIAGNITADPELRHTTGGVPVVNFTVASTPRVFDKDSQTWKDGDTLFQRCSAWRDEAQNIAATLTKGTRVLVTGELKDASYDKDGVQHHATVLEVDEVGPSLKYATAQVTKVGKGSKGGSGQGDAPNQAASAPVPATPAAVAASGDF